MTEYDDLPHKICFRCSAKIEELHEFVTKCVKTQENLKSALGKDVNFITKTKHKEIWEEKLKKSNMNNDAVCDVIIAQAMKRIGDIAPSQVDKVEAPIEEALKSKPVKTASKSKAASSKAIDSKSNTDWESCDDDDKPVAARKSRRSAVISDVTTEAVVNSPELKVYPEKKVAEESPAVKETITEPVEEVKETKKRISRVKKSSLPKNSNVDDEKMDTTPTKSPQKNKDEQKEGQKPFDINEHVSTIKVNGVGVLYQCHLCNRNFLCKDILQTHGCAKTGGVPKLDFLMASVNNDPPKAPSSTVKYITNKPKDNSEVPREEETPKEIEAPKEEPPKIKPKIGPASRVKKLLNDGMPPMGMRVDPKEPSPPPETIPKNISTHSTMEIPSLKNKFRLMPGPNNTFILVEDPEKAKPSVSKRPSTEQVEVEEPKKKKLAGPKSAKIIRPPSPTEVIDIGDDDMSDEGPYPVGLFQTPHKPVEEDSGPLTFTTPAMKKQNYTVVQTGNPSKLLISSKLQPQATFSNVSSKSKCKNKSNKDNLKSEPYKVTLEDTTRPNNTNMLSVFNVDPLLQPSYVLPSDTIQESQISTSTPLAPGSSNSKDIYSCSWCPEKFSREKKLLSHIQAHFNAIDNSERKRRKS